MTDPIQLVPGASAWALVEQRAARTPQATLAVDPAGRSLTCAALRDRALELAGRLAADGVGPGTVVSWQLPSWLGSMVLTAALSRLGAVQNPVLPMLRRRELTFITAQARSSVLVVPPSWRGFDHAQLAREVSEDVPGLQVLLADEDGVRTRSEGTAPLPPEPAGDQDVRWYFYTSGTTADPKGARHGDAALLHCAAAMVERVGVSAEDRLGLPSPLTHVGGIIGFYVSLLTGAVALSEPAFDPARTPGWFRDQGATLLGIGTPFFMAYLDHDDKHPEQRPLFPAVRAFLSGGAPKPVSMHAEMKRRFGGVGIVSGYGMTECPMLAWNATGDADALLAATEGRPVRGVETIVVGADGVAVADGTEGELCVRGPQLMHGYLDAGLDAEAFTAEGFLRTGDLVRRDADGNLMVTGRVKDIIIRNMENVSAKELEDLLVPHPAVRDVAVIGIPAPGVGERICAVVVPADAGSPPELAQLAEHLRAQGVSSRKLPEQIELVPELPRNAMGKVRKAELRQQFAPPSESSS